MTTDHDRPISRQPNAQVTRAEFSQVMDAINHLTNQFSLTQDQRRELQRKADVYESQITPRAKVWKAVKWAAGVLVGGAVAIFGLGVGYQKAIGNNATKTDIQEHVEQDLTPVITEVKEIKTELTPVKEGVKSLVEVKANEREFEKAKRKLDRYDKQHQEALQEYTADKAAGRRAGQRPKKDKPHIDLEEQVAELEKKL